MVENLIAKLGLFVISMISAMGYLGVMLLMAIESACIPLPSEVIMPFSGYLVYTGQFNLWIVAFMGALGCNVGSAVAYEIGYYGGRPLVERYGSYIWLSEAELNWADRFFAKFGDWTVLISRMLPVIRTFIALPAGIARMPRFRFHVARLFHPMTPPASRLKCPNHRSKLWSSEPVIGAAKAWRWSKRSGEQGTEAGEHGNTAR